MAGGADGSPESPQTTQGASRTCPPGFQNWYGVCRGKIPVLLLHGLQILMNDTVCEHLPGAGPSLPEFEHLALGEMEDPQVGGGGLPRPGEWIGKQPPLPAQLSLQMRMFQPAA